MQMRRITQAVKLERKCHISPNRQRIAALLKMTEKNLLPGIGGLWAFVVLQHHPWLYWHLLRLKELLDDGLLILKSLLDKRVEVKAD